MMNLHRCLGRGRQFWPAQMMRAKFIHPKSINKWWCASIRMLHSNVCSQRFVTSLSVCAGHKHNLVQNLDTPIKCNYSGTYTTTTDGDWGEGVDRAAEKALRQLDHIFSTKSNLSDSEWEEVIRLTAQNNPAVTEKSCDALMMLQCLRRNSWILGRSYMEYLSRQGREPNLSTLATYLQLCGLSVAQCGQDTALQVYHQLITRAKVLDMKLTKCAVLGVSVTREWRHAVHHLATIRKISPPCNESYDAVIAAAFRNAEYDLGWHHLDLMCGEGKKPGEGALLEWLRQCRAVGHMEEIYTRATTLLHKLATYEIFPTTPIVQDMAELFQVKLGWSADFVRIPASGHCPVCRLTLNSVGVSKEEFLQLQEEFVPRVLKRSDIFLSSDPREWNKFKEFVEANQPFLAVVDGLNVLHLRHTKMGLIELVQNMLKLSHHRKEGQVLLLGRNHMRRLLPRSLLNTNRLSIYTLNDISTDDGFFLYAALQSGWGTKFITRDLLRDHLFRMDLTALRVTFRRWQRAHQVFPVVTNAGRIKLMVPSTFGTITQGGEAGWHIPYDSANSNRLPYEVPHTWLCLQPPGHSRGDPVVSDPQGASRQTITVASEVSEPSSNTGHNPFQSDPSDVCTGTPRYSTPHERNHFGWKSRERNRSRTKSKVLINDLFESPN